MLVLEALIYKMRYSYWLQLNIFFFPQAEYVDGKVEDILSGNVGGGPDKFFDKFSIVVTVNLEEK